MGSFNFITERLSQIQKELGLTNYAGFFEMATNGSKKIIESFILSADVYYSTTAIPAIKESIQQFSAHKDHHFKLINNVSLINCTCFPDTQATAAILFIDDQFINDGMLAGILTQKKSDYLLYIVFDFYTGTTDNFAALKRSLSLKTDIEYLKAPNLTTVNMVAYIEQVLSGKDLDKLKNAAKVRSMQPVIDTTHEIINIELKIANTQKLLASQDANSLRRDDGFGMNSEVTTTVRQLIQRNILDPDKGFKLKYDELNKPNIGEFSVELDSLSQKLEFEDLDKSEVAEKSEKIETRISAITTTRLKTDIEKKLNKEFKKDIAYINDSVNDCVNKINRFLNEKGFNKINPENIITSPLDTTKVLTANNYIQRQYTGEVTKKGFMEYFVALRDYTGVIMVVVGLFGPLTMLSAFPTDEKEGFWAFLSRISSFLKQFKIIIQLFTIITILTMIVYGIYDLRKRIPRKRKEEKEKEVRKAKESLLQEGKRIYVDSSRDWVALISAYLKDYAQGISNEVDLALRNSMSSKQQQASLKKNEILINQQSVDMKLRSIQSAEKTYEMLSRRFTELKEKAID